jgi:hypothetical protein
MSFRQDQQLEGGASHASAPLYYLHSDGIKQGEMVAGVFVLLCLSLVKDGTALSCKGPDSLSPFKLEANEIM